jgi:hypothetical protein
MESAYAGMAKPTAPTAIAATVRVKLLAIDRMRNPPGLRPSITGRW